MKSTLLYFDVPCTVRYMELLVYITKFTCTDMYLPTLQRTILMTLHHLLRELTDVCTRGMSKHVADFLTLGVYVFLCMESWL